MNENSLEGKVTMIFIMGGISPKNHKPYLQVSDGIEGQFIKISKTAEITPDTFSIFEKGDVIDLEVKATVKGFELLSVV